MNILKSFRNELTILLVTIFTGYALFYKISISNIYIEKQREIKRSIDEINRIIELKRFWRDRAIHKRALEFKNIVSEKKISSFKKRTKSVEVRYRDLSSKDLNRIVKLLVKNPFIIDNLKIDRDNRELYSMELRCRW